VSFSQNLLPQENSIPQEESITIDLLVVEEGIAAAAHSIVAVVVEQHR
jgi:hypothetical protein